MMNTPKEDYEQDQVHADAISCPVMLMEGSDPECSAGVGSDSAPLALDVGGLHGPGSFRPWLVSPVGRFALGRFALSRFARGSFCPYLVGRFVLVFY